MFMCHVSKRKVNWTLNESADKGTNSTVLCPSGEAEGSSAGQEIPCIVWKPKVHYRGHKRPPLVSILSQITLVQVHPSCCLRYILNITLPSTPRFSKSSFTFVFPHPIHNTQCIWVICFSFRGTLLPVLLNELIFRWSVKNEMGRECGTYGRQVRCVLRFDGETWGKKLLGRRRRSWEDNIKMNLQEVWWGAWTGLIWFWIGTICGLLWTR